MSVNSEFSKAVHILTLLALDSENWISSSYISSSVNTNPSLIRKLVVKLKLAGLITTQHGGQGGIKLAHHPSKVTLQDVFKAIVDRGIYSLHSNCNILCPVGSKIESVLRSNFQKYESTLLEVMAKTSIEEVLKSTLDSKRI